MKNLYFGEKRFVELTCFLDWHTSYFIEVDENEFVIAFSLWSLIHDNDRMRFVVLFDNKTSFLNGLEETRNLFFGSQFNYEVVK